MQRHARSFGRNRFKLGLFGMNCSGGLTMTKADDRWDQSWENNLTAARLADDAGLDFLLPIGRWRGYAGETDTEGVSFETLTWAAGLLSATRNINVCGTLHVAFANPLFSAKQMVTADHIGRGRFALNIVSGWNAGEFAMFGVDMKDHDSRYAFTEEWVQIVERVWSEDEPFDHEGRFFTLKNVLGKPKPWAGTRPLLISAGNSAAGRAFAARHVDCLFTGIFDLEAVAGEVATVRGTPGARADLGVYASGHMVARPTAREAEEYYRYVVYEMGDWEAGRHAAAIRTKGRETPFDKLKELEARMIGGVGTFPFIGSYDDLAETFRKLSEAGIDGLALGLVNYITDFPHMRDEILPRLERLGLREKAPALAG